ncbi:DUF2497 domain-containing protein [Mesorhizobium sp.]|uniref:DUF2497 domain-containing protein n=1 Tax=Mesorhizobium sp. TaxID=1871066 RepID=UPI003457DA2E
MRAVRSRRPSASFPMPSPAAARRASTRWPRRCCDNNLPTLVERLVREEIERVARGAQ